MLLLSLSLQLLHLLLLLLLHLLLHPLLCFHSDPPLVPKCDGFNGWDLMTSCDTHHSLGLYTIVYYRTVYGGGSILFIAWG